MALLAVLAVAMLLASFGFVLILLGSLTMRCLAWFKYGEWPSWAVSMWVDIPEPTGWARVDAIIGSFFRMDISLASFIMAVGCSVFAWVFGAMNFDFDAYN